MYWHHFFLLLELSFPGDVNSGRAAGIVTCTNDPEWGHAGDALSLRPARGFASGPAGATVAPAVPEGPRCRLVPALPPAGPGSFVWQNPHGEFCSSPAWEFGPRGLNNPF